MSDAREYLTYVDIAKKASEASGSFNWQALLDLPKELAHAFKGATELAQTLGIVEQGESEQHHEYKVQSQPQSQLQPKRAPTKDDLLVQGSQILKLIMSQKGDVPISVVIAEIDKMRGVNNGKESTSKVSGKTDSDSGAKGIGENSPDETPVVAATEAPSN